MALSLKFENNKTTMTFPRNRNMNLMRPLRMILNFHGAMIILLLGLFSQGAKGQTYKVNVGSATPGCVSYIEVYEYDYVSEKPSFPGGDCEMMAFINSTRRYPAEAYSRGIEGRVTCSFVVNVDGTISHISILRGVETSLNKEAMRVIASMPSWTPGRHEGKAVATRVIRSVPFRK